MTNAVQEKPVLQLRVIGVDDWSRTLYRGSDGVTYVDVDGTPYTVTPDWEEPIEPIGVPYQVVS